MEDLVTFLRAQLDEDEQVARGVLKEAKLARELLKDPKLLGRLIPGWHAWPDVELLCVTRLAEVDAKRRLVDEAIRLMSYDGEFEFLELLALPYAGRPGYRDEWKPVR